MSVRHSWTTRKILLAAGAVVFLALFGLFLRAFLAEPARTVGYLPQLNELRLANLPEGENAWPHYQRASELADEIAREHLGDDIMPYSMYIRSLLTGDWNDPDYERTKALFAALRPVLDVLETASSAPRLDVPIESTDNGERKQISNRHAHLAPIDPLPMTPVRLRPHATLCAVAVRDAAERADWDELLRVARIGFGVTEHALQQPFMIAQLVGAGSRAAIVHEIATILHEHDLPEDVLAELRRLFDAHLTFPLPREAVVLAERYFALDYINIHFTRSGFPIVWYLDGNSAFGPSIGDRISNVGAYFAPNRDRAVRWFEECSDALAAWWSEPAATRSSRPVEPPPPRMLHSDVQYLYEYSSGALRGAVWQLDSTLENIGAARVLLRVHEHRARTGAWPQTLSDAAPPEETISHITGEPLVYLPPNDERPRPAIEVRSIVKHNLRETDPFVLSKPRLPRERDAILVGVDRDRARDNDDVDDIELDYDDAYPD